MDLLQQRHQRTQRSAQRILSHPGNPALPLGVALTARHGTATGQLGWQQVHPVLTRVIGPVLDADPLIGLQLNGREGLQKDRRTVGKLKLKKLRHKGDCANLTVRSQ
ncbi:hypothetical protein GCM10010442_20120 [Kitasatospora kifunensis]